MAARTGCERPGRVGGHRHGAGEPREQLEAMVAYLTEQLAEGEYPHLAAIAGDDPASGLERIARASHDEDRFERGLRRLLDGLEAWVEEARDVTSG